MDDFKRIVRYIGDLLLGVDGVHDRQRAYLVAPSPVERKAANRPLRRPAMHRDETAVAAHTCAYSTAD